MSTRGISWRIKASGGKAKIFATFASNFSKPSGTLKAAEDVVLKF
jgi:hypothetical protein